MENIFISHAISVVLTIVIALVVDYVCCKLLVPLAERIITKKEKGAVEEQSIATFNYRLRVVLTASCHIISAIVVWRLLPHTFADYPTVEMVLRRLTAIYITIMAARTCVVFIDALRYTHVDQVEMGEKEFARTATARAARQQYFRSFCGALKIVIICIAVVFILAIVLNRSITVLLTGIGATSAVLMLVFKDTIEGFVAGIRLTSNDMIHIGDWVTVPGTDANGLVEEITMSTVKIRNFDNTIITVSPQALLNGSFQNWATMIEGGCRRANRLVYFDFNSIHLAGPKLIERLVESGRLVIEEDVPGDMNDTPPEEAHLIAPDDPRASMDSSLKTYRSQLATVTNITLFRRYVEQQLRLRTDVNPEQFLVVRQKEPTAGGLPIEFVFFLRASGRIPFEHLLADIMEWIYALAPEYELKIYQQMALPGDVRQLPPNR